MLPSGPMGLESLVMKKGNEPMFPMKFITPFIEKKEEN